MVDWTDITNTLDYEDWPDTVNAMYENALLLDLSSDTNIPTSAMQWNSTVHGFEIYNGSEFDICTGVFSRDTSTDTIVSSTTETDMHSHTIPADMMETNRNVRLVAIGYCLNDTSSNHDTTWRIYLNTTQIGELTVETRDDSYQHPYRIDCEIVGDGGTGSQMAFSKLLTREYGFTDGVDSVWEYCISPHFNITETSSSDMTLKVSGQMNTSHADRSIHMLVSWLEVF